MEMAQITLNPLKTFKNFDQGKGLRQNISNSPGFFPPFFSFLLPIMSSYVTIRKCYFAFRQYYVTLSKPKSFCVKANWLRFFYSPGVDIVTKSYNVYSPRKGVKLMRQSNEPNELERKMRALNDHGLFNDKTKCHFTLTSRMDYTIEVRDELGKKVEELPVAATDPKGLVGYLDGILIGLKLQKFER